MLSFARILDSVRAEEVGFIRRVPVLDAEGKPTGRTEIRYGEGGELGYMKWLAENHMPAWRQSS